MAENSEIQWTDHTFNPWSGCTKISPECANCYAAVNYSVLMRGVKWGPQGNRIVAAESMWEQPKKWEKKAQQAFINAKMTGESQERPRVFCASLADVFEEWDGPMLDSKKQALYFPHDSWNERRRWVSEPDCGGEERPVTMAHARTRLFELIDATPNLDWLLLTKRPENVVKLLDGMSNGNYGEHGWNLHDHMPNVWLGTTVGHRSRLGAIEELRMIPAAVRFLSVEPLLEDIGTLDLSGIDWVIVGGESGPGSRACRIEWIHSVVMQCQDQGVPVFVKQLGAKPEGWAESDSPFSLHVIHHKKGGDIAEWPEDLRVREFPCVV